MLTLRDADPKIDIRRQLAEEGAAPVVLVNTLTVAEADVDALLAAWGDDARWFKRQPGFVSAQLHRGIAGSTTFLNYAVWRSVADFRAAFTNPAFQAKLAAYPDSTVSAPHLYRPVAVDGVCDA
ncbi:antibiotic biosynthesis monooxygenase family protein [Methylobacterium sp. J-090]|uniref:antibiotic biosynthesis monooxygenase family protein n=1 Tax=Methylobacterium sp. J-090 TaxID=2836666 RepID=UPI001FBA2D28|nr:antibiotic biosynthesis monooxygenase family protein [Methylobacterium sp. J-090]MCJ2082104.1 antibiotic biosynthesis monooxygenase [Methylobacterium sp. J-090]